MARILNKMYDVLFILLVTGFLVWIANMEAGSTAFSKSAIGIILMVVITAIGVLISMLPGFKRLPMVFWVSTCAVIVSLPRSCRLLVTLLVATCLARRSVSSLTR